MARFLSALFLGALVLYFGIYFAAGWGNSCEEECAESSRMFSEDTRDQRQGECVEKCMNLYRKLSVERWRESLSGSSESPSTE